MKLRRLLSYVRRAVEDYKMIEEGDKIAVGISGGKDSIAMLIAMKSLQQFYPKKFELEAVTVSLGYDEMDFSYIKEMCEEMNVNYTVIETDIGEIIFGERKENNPCALCAKLRKGALNSKAEELGCNKVALGHNKDDVIETFFMSLFYEGRINTFAPVTYLSRKKLYSIRPLIYVPEKDVTGFINGEGIRIVKNKCPADGHTKREETKKFVKEQIMKYDSFEEKIFGAIQRSDLNGWRR